MDLHYVHILFQYIAFLFALSVHESAHAWVANRCGDPTARMLGRITLNPIKHIDPIGTVVMPLVAMLWQAPVLGWAKPVPVDPHNFKNHVWDDILTSVAGPASNFLQALCAIAVLATVKLTSELGHSIVTGLARGLVLNYSSLLVPICLLIYALMQINIILFVFNLIPVPPLDGSHVLRHFMPEGVLKIYDSVGIFGLLALVIFGGGLIAKLIFPVLDIFNSILLRI